MTSSEHVHPNSLWRLQADIFVPGENPDAFDALHVSIRDTCMPVTEIEDDLVYEMAVTRWRMRRTTFMEKSLVTVELDRASKDPQNADIAPELFEAKIWLSVSTSSAMKQIHRTENRLRRAYEKAMQELEYFQTRRYENEEAERANRARLDAQAEVDAVEAEAAEAAEAAETEATEQSSTPAARPAHPTATRRLALPNRPVQNEPKPANSESANVTDPRKTQRAA